MNGQFLPSILARHAHDDRTALSVRGQSPAEITFRQLHAAASSLAVEIAEVSRRAQLIPMTFPNGEWPEFAVAYFGVLAAGRVAVPFGSEAQFEASSLRDLSLRMSAGDVARLANRGASGGTSVDLDADDLADITFTSGSTGDPRGVCTTHGQLAFVPEVTGEASAEPLTYVSNAPIGTVAAQGLLVQMLTPRPFFGTDDLRLIVLPSCTPRGLDTVLTRDKPHALRLAPTNAKALVVYAEHHRTKYPSVQWVKVTSAAASAELCFRLQARFPNATISTIYACTEAGRAAVRMQWGVDDATTLGVPIGGTEIAVMDSSWQPSPQDSEGEVCLRLPEARPRRYWNDEAAQQAVFGPAGWVRTGDLGVQTPTGVQLIGRKKEIVNVAGIKISLSRCESIVESVSGVVEAAATAISHAMLGEVLGVCVTVDPASEDPDAVIRSAGSALAQYCPAHRIVRADAIPLLPSGKLDRNALERMILSVAMPQVASKGSPEIVNEVCEEILVVAELDALPSTDARLAELGVSSIVAVELSVRLFERFGVELSYERLLFDLDSPTRIAAEIESARRDSKSQASTP